MNADADLPKSEMIRRSLRCFALGCWSLIPLVSIVTALLAFADFRAVVVGKGRHWNAASRRLFAGACLAGVGLLLNLVITAIIALAIVFG